jgi:hypothetical protein
MNVVAHFSPRGCGQGLCPGIVVTDRGTVLVQGLILPVADKSKLTVPSHEDVVEISREVFEDLLGQYQGR